MKKMITLTTILNILVIALMVVSFLIGNAHWKEKEEIEKKLAESMDKRNEEAEDHIKTLNKLKVAYDEIAALYIKDNQRMRQQLTTQFKPGVYPTELPDHAIKNTTTPLSK